MNNFDIHTGYIDIYLLYLHISTYVLRGLLSVRNQFSQTCQRIKQ